MCGLWPIGVRVSTHKRANAGLGPPLWWGIPTCWTGQHSGGIGRCVHCIDRWLFLPCCTGQNLEIEVNVHGPVELVPTPSSAPYLLSHLLKRVQLAFSAGIAAGTSTAASRTAVRTHRGRDRAPALLYDAPSASFVYR